MRRSDWTFSFLLKVVSEFLIGHRASSAFLIAVDAVEEYSSRAWHRDHFMCKGKLILEKLYNFVTYYGLKKGRSISNRRFAAC